MAATEAALRESWDLQYGAEIDESLVVIEPLGGGTRYEVLRAWDRTLFCQVAVKVVRPHRVAEDRVIDGFLREISIASRLQHPNLVRLLRWSVAPPRPYMVLEYITAQTVSRHLDEVGAISVPEACLLGIRMLSALHYLHTSHVLHLDVKPENVTMGDPPRLLDFSLAQIFSGPVKLRHSLGTPAYMPPEQCTHGEVTPQSDLFALGVTLYEALSGLRPFSHGDPDAADRETRYPQLVEEPQPLGDLVNLHPLLERVVMSCLARDPERRPRSAIEAALAFQSVLESLGTDELYAWPPGLKVRPTPR
ncbi:MAG TPA: serine/threonine-protein kinase [Candidatus Limnocylindria bacterium]|nr:serine/threonine-protein kinase [Candidatus Limnocylindria bacterium]